MVYSRYTFNKLSNFSDIRHCTCFLALNLKHHSRNRTKISIDFKVQKESIISKKKNHYYFRQCLFSIKYS